MSDEEWETLQALCEARGLMSVWEGVYSLQNARCYVPADPVTRDRINTPFVISRVDPFASALVLLQQNELFGGVEITA